MEQDISVVDLYQTDKTVMGGGKLPREIVIQYVWREDVELKGKNMAHLRVSIYRYYAAEHWCLTAGQCAFLAAQARRR